MATKRIRQYLCSLQCECYVHNSIALFAKTLGAIRARTIVNRKGVVREFQIPAPPTGRIQPPVVWPHMTIAITVIMGALMISCVSCTKEEVSQPTWETPFQQWQSLNPHNYTIDQRRTCYCPGGGELVRITIRNDTIAHIMRLSDTSVVTYPFYLTVDSLFGIIHFSKADSLVIRYNSRYGYPEYLDVDPQLHPVDGGVLYETSNLQVQ